LPGGRHRANAAPFTAITSAAPPEIAGWGEVEVLAHHADAPFIRAAAAGPAPDLAGWERPIYDEVARQLPSDPVTPPRIDRELFMPGHAPAAGTLVFLRSTIGRCLILRNADRVVPGRLVCVSQQARGFRLRFASLNCRMMI
jgi:hypothetical protein